MIGVRVLPWNTRRTRGACASRVEWDQGQMMGAALVVKLRAYTRYTRSREWARALRSVLGLLVVTPDPSQEQRIKRIAQSGAEAGLMVHTTTANHLARAATTRANLAHDAG